MHVIFTSVNKEINEYICKKKKRERRRVGINRDADVQEQLNIQKCEVFDVNESVDSFSAGLVTLGPTPLF